VRGKAKPFWNNEIIAEGRFRFVEQVPVPLKDGLSLLLQLEVLIMVAPKLICGNTLE
jgi:hypothetical protein